MNPIVAIVGAWLGGDRSFGAARRSYGTVSADPMPMLPFRKTHLSGKKLASS